MDTKELAWQHLTMSCDEGRRAAGVKHRVWQRGPASGVSCVSPQEQACGPLAVVAGLASVFGEGHGGSDLISAGLAIVFPGPGSIKMCFSGFATVCDYTV